jgi:hypothetical protein
MVTGFLATGDRETGLGPLGEPVLEPGRGHALGQELTVGPGDVMNLDPGHDAWVMGDEPCVVLDTGIAGYAKPAA